MVSSGVHWKSPGSIGVESQTVCASDPCAPLPSNSSSSPSASHSSSVSCAPRAIQSSITWDDFFRQHRGTLRHGVAGAHAAQLANQETVVGVSGYNSLHSHRCCLGVLSIHIDEIRVGHFFCVEYQSPLARQRGMAGAESAALLEDLLNRAESLRR